MAEEINRVTFGTNEFCGPSVISALTGMNTDLAALKISFVTGQSPSKIKGVYTKDLITTIETLGYSCTNISYVEGGSIFAAMSLISQAGFYLFAVPKHFVAIMIKDTGDRSIVDNHTVHPISLSASARLGQQVDGCYLIVKNAEKKYKTVSSEVRISFRVNETISELESLKIKTALSEMGLNITPIKVDTCNRTEVEDK